MEDAAGAGGVWDALDGAGGGWDGGRGYLQYSNYAEDFVEAASGGVEFRQADSTTRVFSETCSSAQPVLNTLMEKLGGSGSVPEVECGGGSKTVS